MTDYEVKIKLKIIHITTDDFTIDPVRQHK